MAHQYSSLDEVRFDRNQRLAYCDWTVLPDHQLTSEQEAVWRTYRQQLREIPNDSSIDLNNVIWPEGPYGSLIP